MFKGKTVLITGASAGFGEAAASLFASAGANLILIARREERLRSLAREIQAESHVEVLSIPLDITDQKAVQDKLGALNVVPDILINNAGLVRGTSKLWETKPEHYGEMIDTNIKGLLNVSYQIIPRMVERNSGHIINVGSVSGHDTYVGGSIYCATKYAVRALTDTLRKELVASPIRVSLVSPGMAQTEFSTVRFSGDQAKADAVYENFIPLQAQDIAEILFFIASRPPHVAIADVVVYPTAQASVSLLHRN